MNTYKKAMLEALEKSLGVVTTAAKISGVSRSSHYLWMNEDDEYKRMVQDIENITIDFAESKLHKLIDEGDTAATIFFLKTKAKKRGYIEKVESETTIKMGLEKENYEFPAHVLSNMV